MGKAALAVEFSFPDLLGAIESARPRLERTIASTIQTQVGMRFDAEGAHNGHEKWEGLKFRQGQILSLTGTLRKSMSPPGAEGNPGPQGFVTHTGALNDLITQVGTKLIYASTHDRGAVIKPKAKQALRFYVGEKVVFAKSVTIPKRSFTDVSTQDKDELEMTLSNLLAEVLEGAT